MGSMKIDNYFKDIIIVESLRPNDRKTGGELYQILANDHGVHKNLLVTVAACSGAYLARIITPMDRSPVFGIIGPVIPVKGLDILQGYKAFFRTLVVTGDGNNALDDLNKAHGGIRRYVLMSSEYLFMKAFKHYIKVHCGEAAIRDRVRYLSDMALKERPDLGRRQGMLEDMIARGLKDNRNHFERMKGHFFMHDLNRDNRQRFNPQYEQRAGFKG